MLRETIVLSVALSAAALLSGSSAQAQQAGAATAKYCLHGSDETGEQKTRRVDALTATRTINNIQFNRPEAKDHTFLRQDQLPAAPFAMRLKDSESEVLRRISLAITQDILPGWKLTLDVSEKGYWFMITDKTDPCGFAFISNQDGVIFTAETLK